MVDVNSAVGFVIARGDAMDRARLSHLRTGATPSAEVFAGLEAGQMSTGGWPAQWGAGVASLDATCFRLAELDSLSGLGRPSATRALSWLASRQRMDGSWEEDPALADEAPPWAQPGDADARFYLTVTAGYWLAVSPDPTAYEIALPRAARNVLDQLDENGAWPGFLVSGWLAGALLQRTEWYYEAARIFGVLTDRVKTMSAADTAVMTVALLRAGVGPENALVVAARQRLDQTQRPDGGWPSDDAPAFDVPTTLAALTALR